MSDKDTHTYLEVNGDFRMRELDHNDLEQFNALLRYAFQVTTTVCFSGNLLRALPDRLGAGGNQICQTSDSRGRLCTRLVL